MITVPKQFFISNLNINVNLNINISLPPSPAIENEHVKSFALPQMVRKSVNNTIKQVTKDLEQLAVEE
jgi:hypothetical protein